MLILDVKFKYIQSTEFCAKFYSNPTLSSLSVSYGEENKTFLSSVLWFHPQTYNSIGTVIHTVILRHKISYKPGSWQWKVESKETTDLKISLFPALEKNVLCPCISPTSITEFITSEERKTRKEKSNCNGTIPFYCLFTKFLRQSKSQHPNPRNSIDDEKDQATCIAM